jgi:hypothetical protein
VSVALHRLARGELIPWAVALGSSRHYTIPGVRMPTTQPKVTVASHFTKSAESVRATYAAILGASRALGPVREEAKKTSIHLVRQAAFAGIATRKDALILTLKAERRVQSPRIHRAEQASANRWHLEVRLTTPADVDAEVCTWLAQAYSLA